MIDKTARDTIALMVERRRRVTLAQHILAWERANGVQVTPMVRDRSRSRMEQLVDGEMKYRRQS